ncbi:MAG: hypothetical protein RLY23_1897, partial [Actinomycetota bacterium]
IRYAFRPQSYWEDADPLSAILRNVTGENRRRMITDYWNAGRLEELDSALLRDEPDDESRMRLGRIHPSFMGGEYLPHYLVGEVEIARLCLQSTTSDVVSLRARPSPEGISYRVIDEYKGRFTLPITTSLLPLTLTGARRAAARAALAEVEALKELAPDLIIEAFDERLTTAIAQRSLLEGDVRRKDRKQVIDKVAAAVMLQSWLDGQI